MREAIGMVIFFNKNFVCSIICDAWCFINIVLHFAKSKPLKVSTSWLYLQHNIWDICN